MTPPEGIVRNLDETFELSRDRFFRGAFEVFQPINGGHRSGSDALLLAASLEPGASGLLADLGAGAGVAGLAALVMNPKLEVVLVEVDSTMAQIARRTLGLPVNAGVASRASIIEASVTLTGRKRQSAGLGDGLFDHVIMNPPYNHPGQKSSPDPLRALAHDMESGGLDAWMRTAAAILKPGGTVHLIYRAELLGDVLAVMKGRFGALELLALHSTSGRPASRIVIRARRGSRAPLSLWRGVALHEADGKPTPIADDLMNGRRRLFMP